MDKAEYEAMKRIQERLKQKSPPKRRKGVTDVRYVCAVPPPDDGQDDETAKDVFWCLWERKGKWLTVQEVAEELGVSEKEAEKALASLQRNMTTTCVCYYDDQEDGQTRYQIPNVFFLSDYDTGTTLFLVGHALTSEERDRLNWEADDLMTNAGLEFAGD